MVWLACPTASAGVRGAPRHLVFLAEPFFCQKKATQSSGWGNNRPNLGRKLYRPPYTNRGVENTGFEGFRMAQTPVYQGLEAIVDWLEFTVLNHDLGPVLRKVLQVEQAEFTDLDSGRFGYRRQKKWRQGTIFVMYNHPKGQSDEMGIHVQLTGGGCRDYEAHHSLPDLLARLVELGGDCNFSRIDLAIDDLDESLLKFDRIHKAALKRRFTSRWSKWQELNCRQVGSGEYLGRTLYFGSQSSDIFCRIYDKTLERQAKGEPDEQATVPPHWTRLEVVYKKERAAKLAGVIVDGSYPVGAALRATLNQYIRFVRPAKGDSNKARWPSAKWWVRFLAGVDKLSLSQRIEPKSIEDMTAWLDKQIGPTIAAVTKAKEGELDWLYKIITGGKGRLSQRHLDAILQYQINNERDD